MKKNIDLFKIIREMAFNKGKELDEISQKIASKILKIMEKMEK